MEMYPSMQIKIYNDDDKTYVFEGSWDYEDESLTWNSPNDMYMTMSQLHEIEQKLILTKYIQPALMFEAMEI